MVYIIRVETDGLRIISVKGRQATRSDFQGTAANDYMSLLPNEKQYLASIIGKTKKK